MTRPPVDTTPPLRKQYLHVTVYRCSNQCKGPVVACSLGIRETVVARETESGLSGEYALPAVPGRTAFLIRFPPASFRRSSGRERQSGSASHPITTAALRSLANSHQEDSALAFCMRREESNHVVVVEG